MRQFLFFLAFCLALAAAKALAQKAAMPAEHDKKVMTCFFPETRKEHFSEALRIELAGREVTLDLRDSAEETTTEGLDALCDEEGKQTAYVVQVEIEKDSLGLSEKPTVSVYACDSKTQRKSQLAEGLDSIEARVFALTVVSLMDELSDPSVPKIAPKKKPVLIETRNKSVSDTKRESSAPKKNETMTLSSKPKSFMAMSGAFVVSQSGWIGAGVDARVSLPFFDFYSDFVTLAFETGLRAFHTSEIVQDGGNGNVVYFPAMLSLRVAVGSSYEGSLALGVQYGTVFWNYPSTDPVVLSQKTSLFMGGGQIAHRSILWLNQSLGLNADFSYSARSYGDLSDQSTLFSLEFALGMVWR